MSETSAAGALADHACEALLILGVTLSGRPFRPSDWVDRLAGGFSSFGKDKLLRYAPAVRPVTFEGTRGLRVDMRLLQADPAAFRFVMNFAVDNDLTFRCLDQTGAIGQPAGR
jgi:hypothetical protein